MEWDKEQIAIIERIWQKEIAKPATEQMYRSVLDTATALGCSYSYVVLCIRSVIYSEYKR